MGRNEILDADARAAEGGCFLIYAIKISIGEKTLDWNADEAGYEFVWKCLKKDRPFKINFPNKLVIFFPNQIDLIEVVIKPPKES